MARSLRSKRAVNLLRAARGDADWRSAVAETTLIGGRRPDETAPFSQVPIDSAPAFPGPALSVTARFNAAEAF